MLSGAVCGSVFEATEGQDVTISFKISELLGANHIRIIQTRTGHQKSLVARFCFQHEACVSLNRPGVLVQVEGETLSLTLQKVNSSRDSGLYEVEVFNGKHVTEINVTLVVLPLFPSIPPTQGQPPKPPDFSEWQRIPVLIPLVVFILVVVLVVCLILRKHRRAQRPHNRKSAAVCYKFNFKNSGCLSKLDQSDDS